MPTDFLPHDLTSNTSHSPYITDASSFYGASYAPWLVLDNSLAEYHGWLGTGAGVDWLSVSLGNFDRTFHDLTSNTSHSPLVVSASSYEGGYGGYPPWHTLNGGIACWLGTGAGVDWLKYDLGSGNAVVILAYCIQVNSVPEPNRAPKSWTLQGSNDDSNWTTIDTVTNQTGWGSGERRFFACDNVSTAYRYFKLNITENNGDGTYTQVQEIYLYATPPSGTQKTCGSYAIVVNTVPEPTRAPKTWKLQGSNDLATWDDLDTVASETSWGSGETRTFTCDVATTAYWAFRVNITANNGDATYTQIGELYLYEYASPAALDQHSFRIRNDDGSESAATWAAALNTNLSTLRSDTNLRIRFCIDNSQGGQSGSFTPQLRYSLNGGAWTNVTGASSVVRSYASPNVADNTATTEQLAGPATFVAGAFDEVDGALAAITLATTEETEVEFCARIQTADVAAGDTIQLRVSDAGAALYSYTSTPTVSLGTARIAQIPRTVWYEPTTQQARVAQVVRTVWILQQTSSVKAVSTVLLAGIKKIAGVAIAVIKKLAGVANQ